jgi:alpha-beta hydrolase superfamily lysophospholipase
MLSTTKVILNTFKLLLIFYVLICVLLYFFQEKLIFFPDKLNRNYRFLFSRPFEEMGIRTNDGQLLNALLFTSEKSRGLVFYLHGNAGALHTWGEVAKRYTSLNYDVFILDYRGFGKSEGSIKNQGQFFEDIQTAYNEMKKRYSEDSIIVLGYSIGTGPAAQLASLNQPKLLILQAPYFSMTDLMSHSYPLLPTFLLKYKFKTNGYIKECKMPVIIFHGDQDEVIYYGSSLKLKETLKATDTLITLHGQGHNGITDNEQYIHALSKILN